MRLVAKLCNNHRVYVLFIALFVLPTSPGETNPHPAPKVQQQLKLVGIQDSARRTATRLRPGLDEELPAGNSEDADGRRRLAAGLSREAVKVNQQCHFTIKSRFLINFKVNYP